MLSWIAGLGGLVGLGLALPAAYSMVVVAPWDTLTGTVGAILLRYPLHVLIPAACAGMFAAAAVWAGSRFGAYTGGAAALILVGLALWPPIAQWRTARLAGVAVSVADHWTGNGLLSKATARPARAEVYGVAADGSQLLLDVWPAPTMGDIGPRPALVRLHGGGWAEGARGDMPAWNQWLNEQGFHVFDVSYRMNTASPWRDEVGDVKCALGWVRANAAKLGVDPERISVIGNSAGGHLAMLAAYTMGSAELPPSCDVAPVPVRAVVNIYGPSDLTTSVAQSVTPRIMARLLRGFVGDTPPASVERLRLASPLFSIGVKSPPTISFIGHADRLIAAAQIVALDEALARAGVPHESWYLPATDHAYDVNWGHFSAQFTRAKVAEFLRRNG